MSRPRLPRRALLRGAGGVLVSLPLFESLGCDGRRGPAPGASRSRLAFPKRFIVVYTPNGQYEPPPTLDFAGTTFEPLAPFVPKLNLVRGLDMSVHDEPPGEPHQQGMAFLTGRRLNEGTFLGSDSASYAGWASGISVDQEVAKVLCVDTPYRSLHLGVQSTLYAGTEVRTIISYAGSDQPIANETSPFAVFDRMFAPLGPDGSVSAELRARRKSVLDVVGRQYESVNARLGAADRQKLEQHLASIRDVEGRLSRQGSFVAAGCKRPELGEPAFDLNDPANFPLIGKLQTDLLVMALACDLTRVATLQWSSSANNRPFPFLSYNGQPITGDDHLMGHSPDSDVETWGKLRVIRRWYLEQFAYLLRSLDSIQESDGSTMLDNTAVLLGSELSRGNTHSHSNMNFVLAGGAAGAWRTGRYLNYEGVVPHNNLLVSILNGMGVEGTTFGDPTYCTGPLAELTPTG
ncbi:MAG TPA: DUF1552 domain-containing protein [Polyangiaceae bacterium]|nr:DUF1552 domain-containing protein [Polyangiaceae bacterium]